jgi:hypothetical protein
VIANAILTCIVTILDCYMESLEVREAQLRPSSPAVEKLEAP